jgi:hypothetical protein
LDIPEPNFLDDSEHLKTSHLSKAMLFPSNSDEDYVLRAFDMVPQKYVLKVPPLLSMLNTGNVKDNVFSKRRF